jgi:hypothetical protein
MSNEPTQFTVVSDHKALRDYQRGNIGQPEGKDQWWLLYCLSCGPSSLDLDMIVKHDDGTVSSTKPLYCHRNNSIQQYMIVKNKVRLL